MNRTDLDGKSLEEHRALINRLRSMTPEQRAQETIALLAEGLRLKALALRLEHTPFQWTDD